MLPRIVGDYKSGGLEEAGELAGLSEGGRAGAMLVTT
jgi:hypothetical protein